MNKINKLSDYNNLFHESEIISKALETALDVRKFEIDLYWKRATYYWTFISIILIGFFALDISKIPKYLEFQFFLCVIGIIFSTAWYLVNRGSKYWQENWEFHVNLLEDEHIGKLFKTIISKEYFRFKNLLSPFPYSVGV